MVPPGFHCLIQDRLSILEALGFRQGVGMRLDEDKAVKLM